MKRSYESDMDISYRSRSAQEERVPPPLFFESRFEGGNLRKAVRVGLVTKLVKDVNDPKGWNQRIRSHFEAGQGLRSRSMVFSIP